jgi:DNA polymerase III epsilon subunit
MRLYVLRFTLYLPRYPHFAYNAGILTIGNLLVIEFAEERPSEIPIVIIDTETTGLIPEMGHRVVEIAAVRWENGREVAQFSTLLNPGRKIEPEASRINGLSDRDLIGQPAFADIAERLLAFVDGALLVAHNAAFDAGFVGMELFINQYTGRGQPATLPNPWLCTLELARGYFHFGQNNLGAIAQRLGVRSGRAHRALTDVYTTGEIFKRMARELEKQRLVTVGDLLYAQGGPKYTPNLPRFVLPEVMEGAIRDGRHLTIHYQNKNNAVIRTITPRYPTHYHDHTYLVAYCHSRQDQRTFRLDRIMGVERVG